MTHRDTPTMTRHLIAAARRRDRRPLRFHSNRGGHPCPGHRSRRAAARALAAPGAGPVDVCLRILIDRPPRGARWWHLVPNHSF